MIDVLARSVSSWYNPLVAPWQTPQRMNHSHRGSSIPQQGDQVGVETVAVAAGAAPKKEPTMTQGNTPRLPFSTARTAASPRNK